MSQHTSHTFITTENLREQSKSIVGSGEIVIFGLYGILVVAVEINSAVVLDQRIPWEHEESNCPRTGKETDLLPRGFALN